MKTAIVTGAGSGIGKAIAFKLAGMGYHLALTGRTLSKVVTAATQINAAGGKALGTYADVSQPADLQALINRVMEQWGRIDVVVNNAGYAPSIPTHQLSEEQWREIIDTNLSSAFHAARLVWPIMRKQADGVIINISSMAARDPFPGLGAYAAAKAALNMLTLSLAREGDAVGIRVIGIAPAGVDTPMFSALVGEKNVDRSQILQPEDVAEAVAGAIEGGLRYTSGETIFIHRKPA